MGSRISPPATSIGEFGTRRVVLARHRMEAGGEFSALGM